MKIQIDGVRDVVAKKKLHRHAKAVSSVSRQDHLSHWAVITQRYPHLWHTYLVLVAFVESTGADRRTAEKEVYEWMMERGFIKKGSYGTDQG